jgi:hypothetical protein
MLQEKERPPVSCPACKTRMSVRRIAHGSAEDVDEFIYHCPMCDIETKQQVLHLSSSLQSAPQATKSPWQPFKHAAQ